MQENAITWPFFALFCLRLTISSQCMRTIYTVLLFSSQSSGYSAEMKKESLDAYEFPDGSAWQKLINEGLFKI